MGIDRVDVTAWEHVREEPQGATAKEWVRDPRGESSHPEHDWLFKAVVTHENGSRQAGDWTECVGAAVARHLAIPSAETRLAHRAGTDGVIVRNVRPAGFDMWSGRLAMYDLIGVETRGSRRDKTASLGHTLENLMLTLARHEPPPSAPSWRGCTAQDVMAGYLVLDAFIGNTDRHEQNWSILRRRRGDGAADHLASTYDLGASLGFQLTDAQRSDRLRDRGALEAFASKGFAKRFDGDRSTTLVALAARAVEYCSSRGKARIHELLGAISAAEPEELVATVNGMSVVTRTFASEVLRTNGRRLSDADWN